MYIYPFQGGHSNYNCKLHLLCETSRAYEDVQDFFVGNSILYLHKFIYS